MNRDETDFFIVLPQHLDIHDRLRNWARYIAANGYKKNCAPMFQHYRSSEVWAETQAFNPVDRIDGHRLEKAIGALPDKHKYAVRWVYVYSCGGDGRAPVWPKTAQRSLGVNREGLVYLINAARSMLRNTTGSVQNPQNRENTPLVVSYL